MDMLLPKLMAWLGPSSSDPHRAAAVEYGCDDDA